MEPTVFDPDAERERGVAFVRAGLVRPEDLDECLDLQRRRAAADSTAPPIDRILVAKGYLEIGQLGRNHESVLLEHRGEEGDDPAGPAEGEERTLARCPECFRAYRIQDFQPDNHGCIECGGLLIEVAEVAVSSIDPVAAAAGPAEDLYVGVGFDGYPIRALLGADELGTTYLALDPRSGAEVAIKVHHPERAGDAFLRRDFLRNARRAMRVRHPGIQRAYRIGRRGRIFYTVTEPIDGRLLEEILHERGSLGYEEAVDLVYRLADCLAFLHAQGVVHRSLHPSRVVVGPDGSVHLLGTGLFLPVSERPAKPTAGATRGRLLDEPITMAPEQGREPWLFDPRTDVFALGCMAHQFFSGQAAYRGASAIDVLAHYLQWGAPTLDRRGVIELPRELVRLVEKMVQVEPESRPQSMDEVLRVLESLPRAAEFASRQEGHMEPATEEETAWPAERERTVTPGEVAESFRVRAKKRKKLKREGLSPFRRIARLVPLASPAFRRTALSFLALFGAGLAYQKLSASFGLETEERIIVETRALEVEGEPLADALSPEEVQDLWKLRRMIAEGLSEGRIPDALTAIEKALSVHRDGNPWAGDLWFLRGLAAYQIARFRRGISEAEAPTYFRMAVESYARAAEAYRRPGARTRFDAGEPAWFPFQRADSYEGDLGYVYTQAVQSHDWIAVNFGR